VALVLMQTAECCVLLTYSQSLVQDLKLVKEEMVKRFPPAYDIFNFYLEMYHDRARTTIDGFAENVDGVCPSGPAFLAVHALASFDPPPLVERPHLTAIGPCLCVVQISSRATSGCC
jgi:hypothetical protein